MYLKLMCSLNIFVHQIIYSLTSELNRVFSKEEVQMAKKVHEEIFNIPGPKVNANQNYIKILPHSS
jgi:hypothetical protein